MLGYPGSEISFMNGHHNYHCHYRKNCHCLFLVLLLLLLASLFQVLNCQDCKQKRSDARLIMRSIMMEGILLFLATTLSLLLYLFLLLLLCHSYL